MKTCDLKVVVESIINLASKIDSNQKKKRNLFIVNITLAPVVAIQT